MAFAPIDLSAFPGEREHKLRGIKRYSLFEVMYYRPNVWQHVHRVLWIVEELAPFAHTIGADIEKARALALVHDDAEMLTGDHQAGHKGQMTKEQLQKLDEEEESAARKLADMYPKTVHGYEYGALLLHAIHKDCPEALLVMYADKFDAYNETLHEILAGNNTLLWSLMFYEQWFAKYVKKFPALAAFAAEKSPFILGGDNRFQPHHVDTAPYRHAGRPHTEESLGHSTDFAPYNAWREMVVRHGGGEGKQWLLDQQEKAIELLK
jgi:5'-deoxynucleotidase YfbR-like HD superfamily hydrolase